MAPPHMNHPHDLHASGTTSLDFKGPRGSLQHRCGACLKVNEDLPRCGSCKVVRYCSREHQAHNRQKHKAVCNKVKKTRAKLEKEDHALRNATPDFMTPANAFETHVGHFWGMLPTRDYMRVRYALAETVRRLGTLDGVTEALDHLQDMLRLSEGDNMGVRYLVPAMMLQLDRDQECYDFIKWWETERRRDDLKYNSDDLLILGPMIQNANVLEDVKYLKDKFGNLLMLVPALLLMMKLLKDVVTLKLTRKVIEPLLPPELWSRVDDCVVRSSLSHRWSGYSYGKLTAVEQRLELQVKVIAKFISNTSDHLPHALLEPDPYLCVLPEHYGSGSFEETSMALQYNYAAFWEHEDVLELLQSSKKIAALDSEDEIEGMMTGSTFKANPGSDRSKEELLEDVSLNRLWGYFDEAVEDAFSLSKFKPSATRHGQRRAWMQEYSENEDD